MALQMKRAFNSKMLSSLTRYKVNEGSHDATNEWVEGTITSEEIRGVFTSGNKFSQFDEGIAIHNEVGGIRSSDYKRLYITASYSLNLSDKVGYMGKFYNVLQQTEERLHGFEGFLVEKSKTWSPT